MAYKVFVSHGWHDRWIARQVAFNVVNASGAEVFIDIFDIKSGDRIEERVHSGTNHLYRAYFVADAMVGRSKLGLE